MQVEGFISENPRLTAHFAMEDDFPCAFAGVAVTKSHKLSGWHSSHSLSPGAGSPQGWSLLRLEGESAPISPQLLGGCWPSWGSSPSLLPEAARTVFHPELLVAPGAGPGGGGGPRRPQRLLGAREASPPQAGVHRENRAVPPPPPAFPGPVPTASMLCPQPRPREEGLLAETWLHHVGPPPPREACY